MAGNKGRVNLIIQARDRHLLSEIGLLCDIDLETAMMMAPYGSKTQGKLRLLELTRAGYLTRYFVGTINGGRKAIYRLSPKGAALVRAPVHSPLRKLRSHVASDLFLEHRLRINSVFLILKYGPIPVEGVQFRHWRGFSEPITKSIGLIPDAYCELMSAPGIRPMFLEVDLGTEALQVWVRKTQRYLQFATSGEFARMFEQPQFRVLVIADSARRLENIRATVARSIDRIFWFTTFELINREDFWSAIWLRPTGDQKQSLL